MMKEKSVNLRWTIRVVVLAAMLATTIMVTLLSSPPVYAAAYTASVSGNWSNTATWGGSGPPVAGDTVTINANVIVTVDVANAECASIAFLAPNANNGITISGTNTLTVSGAITTTIPGGNTRATTIAVGAGSLSAGSIALAATIGTARYSSITISTGTVTVSGSITSSGIGSRLIFSGAGTVNVGGTFMSGTAGTFTSLLNSLSTVNYTGANANLSSFAYIYQNLTFSGTGDSSAGGTVTIQGNLANTGGGTLNFSNRAVTFSGTVATQSIDGFITTGAVSMTKTAGTATFTGDVNGGGLTLNGNGGTLDLGDGLTHTFTGTFTRTNGTLNLNSSSLHINGATSGVGGTWNSNTSTVDYGRGGAQTVFNVSYYNLTLSGTGTNAKTFPAGTTTINGSFLRQGTAAPTIQGNFINNGGGPIDFGNAIVTISGTQATQSICGFNTTSAISVTKATTTPSTVTITSDVNAASLSFTTAASNTTVSLDSGVALALTGGLTISRPAAASTTGSTLAVNDGSLSCTTIALGGTGAVATRSTTLSISTGTVTASGSITSAGNYSYLTFSDAGTLYAGGTFMSGTWGTFTCSTGTVNFKAAGAQSIAPFAYTFNNVTLSGSGAKTLTNASIGGILSMEGTATTIGTPTSWGTTLQYKGLAAQTTGTEFPATFSGTGGVIINNANGVNLNESKTTTYGLTLTSGNINTGANTLIIAAGGSISGGSASSYVYGNLQKVFNTGSPQAFTFPIGDTGNYTPIALANIDVGTAGSLTAYTTTADHPNVIDDSSDINASASVNRYWTLTDGDGFASSSYDATFTFSAGDVDSGADNSSFIVGNYNGSGWTDPYPTVGTKEATSTQAIGLTYFGEFAIGEVAIIIIPVTIEISVPSAISFGDFNIGEINPNSSTLNVTVSSPSVNWSVTAKDTDIVNTNGFMTLWVWNGSSYTYNTSVKLYYAMNISGTFDEVTLPNNDGADIARGMGTDDAIPLTFKQEVTWDDEPGDYQIVVTFIATIDP